MADTCVAHLVRKQNGLAPFKAFMDSYRACRPGIPHELLLIFKGFQDEAELENYRSLLDGIDYGTFLVSDGGFDISAYFATAQAFDHPFFCFLNSFSVILDKEWLEKLQRSAELPGVGVVGATG